MLSCEYWARCGEYDYLRSVLGLTHSEARKAMGLDS